MSMKLSTEHSADKGKSRELLKRCVAYFRPYVWRVVLGVASMLVVAVCMAGIAYLVQPALDDIFFTKDLDALILIPLAYILVILVKGVFQFLQNYMMKYSGFKVLEDLRNDLYDKMARLPIRFHEENEVGMLMSRIINDVLLIRMSMPALVMAVRQVLTMAALIGVVFYRDWFLAIFAVLVLPLAVFPFIYFAKKLRKLSRRNQTKIADISTVIQEVLSGIRVVKAFATEKKEVEKFKGENARLVKIAVHQVVVDELSSRVMELVGAVGIGLVIWYGGYQVIQGHSTPGTFFSFIAGLIMLYEPMKKLNTANLDLQQALAGAERVFEVLESEDILIEDDGTLPMDQEFKSLAFEGVTFAYDGNDTPALDSIDLTIDAGERVAIVGPSGGGKTTLVNLIPRFYLPQSGRILINGKDLNDFQLAGLRRSLGMVSQDPFLFNVSVRDNIAYGQAKVDEDDVVRAAKAAFAHEFVSDLPEGYDTIIGERGVKLSGGQKQRLTIARALLKNPPLLILDEATSALDTQAEQLVQKALENLMQGRTSIVIAHRLSTVLNADRILVMDKGRITAQGPHEQLLETSPLYARLYRMQFEGRG